MKVDWGKWLDEDKDGVRWNADVDRPWEWWKHDDPDDEVPPALCQNSPHDEVPPALAKEGGTSDEVPPALAKNHLRVNLCMRYRRGSRVRGLCLLEPKEQSTKSQK